MRNAECQLSKVLVSCGRFREMSALIRRIERIVRIMKKAVEFTLSAAKGIQYHRRNFI